MAESQGRADDEADRQAGSGCKQVRGQVNQTSLILHYVPGNAISESTPLCGFY